MLDTEKVFNDFRERIEKGSLFEVEVLASKFKPYLEENLDKLNGLDGYNIALLTLNLRTYAIGLKHLSQGEVDEPLSKFIDHFEELLKLLAPHLNAVVDSYTEEVELLKVENPELYEELLRITEVESKSENS